MILYDRGTFLIIHCNLCVSHLLFFSCGCYIMCIPLGAPELAKHKRLPQQILGFGSNVVFGGLVCLSSHTFLGQCRLEPNQWQEAQTSSRLQYHPLVGVSVQYSPYFVSSISCIYVKMSFLKFSLILVFSISLINFNFKH